MSKRPTVARERKKEAPPAEQRDIAAEPLDADESIPADNRYAPASGILTPIHAPMSGAQ
jgi:hypothetical protein